MMKKFFALFVALMTLFSLSASAEAPLDGGWTLNTENVTVIPEDVQAALDKALENFVGSSIEPVAFLASQVVAGMNYSLLCKVTPVVPDAVPSYQIVVVYSGVNGDTGLSFAPVDFSLSGADVATAGMTGGWSVPETPDVTEDAANAVSTATQMMVGSAITPVALLATQVVAGLNYSLLCVSTPVVPDAVPSFVIARVYAALDGTAEIEVAQLDYTAEAAE